MHGTVYVEYSIQKFTLKRVIHAGCYLTVKRKECIPALGEIQFRCAKYCQPEIINNHRPSYRKLFKRAHWLGRLCILAYYFILKITPGTMQRGKQERPAHIMTHAPAKFMRISVAQFLQT